MSQEIKQRIDETLEQFVEIFNTRDPKRWSEILHYPHLQCTPFREPKVFTTKEDYAAATDFNRMVEMGWHHSTWDYKELIQVSDDKVHAFGQYTRYKDDGGKLHANTTAYILTRVSGQWGIQARFNTGLFLHPLSAEADPEEKAKDIIEVYFSANGDGATKKRSDLFHFPCFDIHDNRVDQFDSYPEGGQSENLFSGSKSKRIKDLRVFQKSGAAVNIAVESSIDDSTADREKMTQEIYIVILKNDRWGIMARSAL